MTIKVVERANQSRRKPGSPGPRRLHRFLVPALLFLGSAALMYFMVATLLRPGLPDAIVGDWRIEDGDMKGAWLSFARDGTFNAILIVNNNEAKVEAAVEMSGDTLRYTYRDPNTRTKQVKVQIIRSLSEREMIVEENRQRIRLSRVGVKT